MNNVKVLGKNSKDNKDGFTGAGYYIVMDRKSRKKKKVYFHSKEEFDNIRGENKK